MMKKYLVPYISMLISTSNAFAANWLEIQNNVPPLFDEYHFFGFIQPTYTANEGGSVTTIPKTTTSPINGDTLNVPIGITSYNGQTPLFNLVGPDLDSSDELRLLRARYGVRGVIPETDERINYFLQVGFGDNALTREQEIVFTEASLTFNYIPGGRVRYLPGARIRVGLGRLPLGEEAMQGIKNIEYINFTNVTHQLLNERFVEPYNNSPGRSSPSTPGVSLAMAKTNGPFNGFRDVGVEVYDWYNEGAWEYAYAFMISQANGLKWNQDLNSGNYDITTRLQASYVFAGAGPKRNDLTTYVWRQDGKREFGDMNYDRIREGIGFRLSYKQYRLSGEYIRARGMIFYATQPAFNDIGAPAFEPVDRVALESSNRANGYYLDIGWRFLPKWEIDLRYDVLNKLTNSDYDEVKISTWTLGLQYFYTPKLRLTLNYDIRDSQSAHPNARLTNPQIIQGTVGEAIRDSMGDRLSAQLTWFF